MIEQIGLKPMGIAGMQSLVKPDQADATDITQQFSSFLNDAITNLSNQEAQVDQLNTRFISGDLPDVHQLMIAAEKATLGLELTLQVRNKIVEAYQDVMRMHM